MKLTDFGIARNVSERTMTRTGIMLGSPAYIAPEVAAGREVTPAADLWGLGATLFAVLEGRPPYDVDGSVLEIVNTVVHGEVPRPDGDRAAGRGRRRADGEGAGRADLARAGAQPAAPAAAAADHAAAVRGGPDAAGQPGPAADPVHPEAHAAGAAAASPAATGRAASAGTRAGPLPFHATTRRAVPRRRGRVASAVLVVVAAVLFCGAAGGGFALARVVGGHPLLPPEQTSTPSTPAPPEPSVTELDTQTGDAATTKDEPGGGYSLAVPRGWARFVEQRQTDDGVNSTRVYYSSTDGRQVLSVERFTDYLFGHGLDDYVNSLEGDETVTYSPEKPTPIAGLAGSEPGEQLIYRTTTEADNLAPGKRDVNRVTFANLLPLRGDLWVVAVTVPVDQEDSGRTELFDRIARTFEVTG